MTLSKEPCWCFIETNHVHRGMYGLSIGCVAGSDEGSCLGVTPRSLCQNCLFHMTFSINWGSSLWVSHDESPTI